MFPSTTAQRSGPLKLAQFPQRLKPDAAWYRASSCVDFFGVFASAQSAQDWPGGGPNAEAGVVIAAPKTAAPAPHIKQRRDRPRLLKFAVIASSPNSTPSKVKLKRGR